MFPKSPGSVFTKNRKKIPYPFFAIFVKKEDSLGLESSESWEVVLKNGKAPDKKRRKKNISFSAIKHQYLKK
jgi:hypothetical protein